MNTVTVLMSTYNGERFLKEQIESLIHQKNVQLKLLVRDDGSSDNTINILEKYQKQGVLQYYQGENCRSARSFMNLVKKAPDSEYYSFCDQDDVWKEEKLSRALTKIREIEDGIPVLYCSDYQLVDSNLKPFEASGHKHKTMTTFKAGIVSSCATGCTVVFNRALRNLLTSYTPEYQAMHDSWACRVCLAVGGIVIYDEGYRSLLYRQHGNNVVGANPSLFTRIKRLISRISSSEHSASRQAEELLKGYGQYMSSDNREVAELVAGYRQSFFKWLKLLFSKDIITPYWDLNKGIKMAILFRYL